MSLYDVLLARALTPQSRGGSTGIKMRMGTAENETELTFALSIDGANEGDAEIYLSDLSALSGQVALDDGTPRIVGIRYSASGGMWITTANQSGISQNTDAYGAELLEWGDQYIAMSGDLQIDTGAVFVKDANYRIFYWE